MTNRDLFFNAEVEQSVLGSILLENSLIYRMLEYDVCIFYKELHQKIFRVIKKMTKAGTTADLITISEFIKRNRLDIPISYLSDLLSSIPTTANFDAYLSALLEMYEKREIEKTLKNIDFTSDVENIKTDLFNSLNKINSLRDVEESMQDYLFIYYENLDNLKDDSIKTGYRKIDGKLRGFGKSQLITIAACAGIGKSTFATNLMLNQIKSGYNVDYFSLEMPKDEILNKLISNFTKIEYKTILEKTLSDPEKDRIAKAINFLASKHFEIYDKKSSVETIVSQIRKDKLRNGLEIAYIDLINRVTSKEKSSSRAEFIGSLTRQLKLLAMELEIPIVILAQINRDAEKKSDSRPMLAELKESGSIAEDSDNVIALYRNRKLENGTYRAELQSSNKLDYNSRNPDYNPERIEILILKGRYCGGAQFSMKWLPNIQRIDEVFGE